MIDFEDILRRHFVAIATAQYTDESLRQLDGVKDEVELMRGWLTSEDKLGDRRFIAVHDELRTNPTKSQIRDAFEDPASAIQWREADAAVVYITGHGVVKEDEDEDGKGEQHFLVLQNTDLTRLRRTGFATADLFGWLAESEIEHLLVIVDACYAGHVADQVEKLAKDHWLILPSATKGQRARLGALTEAIRKFVDSGAKYNTHSPYLPVGVFVTAVNHGLPAGQKVKHIYKGEGDGRLRENDGDEHVCLPNPHFDPGHELVQTEPGRRELALRKVALELHNRIAGRLPTADEPGWLFTCRARLMRDLVAAARTPGVTMVTGSVGSGKSAALSRLVTLSDPQFRTEYADELRGVPEELTPRPEAVQVAISARKKPSLEIVTLLCHHLLGSLPRASLGEDPVAAGRDALISFLAGCQQPVTIVVDALDEAEDPSVFVQNVLAPLVREDSGRLCLLVGVRSPGGDGATAAPVTVNGQPLPDLVAAELSARRIQVDRDPWWSQQDIDTFVRHILLNTEDSPYQDAQGPFITAVIDAINGVARSSYLVAEVAASSLADRSDIIALDDQGWREALKGGLVGVLRDDIQVSLPTLEARRRGVVLLRAVAFARSIGLPWSDVWPRVAEAADVGSNGASTYGDPDVESLLGSRLNAYLVTDQEDDLTVYRLMHNELRQTLRYQWQELLSEEPATPASDEEIAAIERQIAGRLQPLTEPTLAVDQAPAPYVRRHLAEHAIAGGVLDERVPVPFLPYLDLGRLRAIVNASPTRRQLEADVPWLRVLWQVTHLWDWNRPGRNAAAIEMWAALNGVILPGSAREPGPTGGTWRVRWAVCPPNASNVLGHQGNIGRAAATADLAGVPIAVTGAEDGKLYVWDLATGGRYRDRDPIDTEGGAVLAVATAQLPDRQTVAVTGGADGTVRIWDLGSGRSLGELAGEAGGSIQAVTVGTLPGPRVVVAAADEYGTVRAWDLIGRHPVGEQVACGPGLALGLATAVVGQQVLGVATGRDNGLQLWDLATGVPVGDRLTGHPLARRPRTGTESDGRAIATLVLDKREVAITGNSDGLLLWDLRNRACIRRRLAGSVGEISSLAVSSLPDGQVEAVTGGSRGVQIWDLAAGEPVGDPLVGHTDAVEAVAFLRAWDGTPVAVSTGRDKSVRNWEVPTAALSASRPWSQQLAAVGAVATVRSSPRTPALAVSCSGAVVYVWDLEQGGEPVLLADYDSPVVSVAAADSPDGTLIVAGHFDGWISAWSPADRRRVSCARIGPWDTARVLATAELADGRVIALAGGWDDNVRLWDPLAGAPAGPALQCGADVVAIATITDGDRTLCICGTSKGHVCIRDLNLHLDPLLPVVRPPIDVQIGANVASLTTATLADGRICAVVGVDNGTVHIVDLLDGGVVGQPWQACAGTVTAVAAGLEDGRAVVFTGSDEAFIQAWNASTGQPIGEALPVPGPVRALAFQHESSSLVVGGTGVAVARPRFGRP